MKRREQRPQTAPLEVQSKPADDNLADGGQDRWALSAQGALLEDKDETRTQR